MPTSNFERTKLSNLRHHGGLQTPQGVVRSGITYRSDNLSNIDEEQALDLVNKGIALIIDLRTGAELDRHGRGRLETSHVGYAHLPIDEIDDLRDEVNAAAIDREIPFTNQMMGYCYFRMLESNGRQIVKVLENIAAQDGAVLFHCAAGKDRTGLVAASLLSVLGAERAAIIDDFSETNNNFEHLMLRLSNPDKPFDMSGVAKIGALATADAEALEHFFAILDEQETSLLEALRDAGLTPETEINLLAKHF
jgi:protein-tyrosine phosphatase